MANTAGKDVKQMYERYKSNILPDALAEMHYEKIADSGQQYYMFLPRKYLFNRGIRILLIFLLCILACYKYFTLSTPPLFLIAFRKFDGYCKYLQAMNVSVKKLRLILAVWIIICIGLHFAFWTWIKQLF